MHFSNQKFEINFSSSIKSNSNLKFMFSFWFYVFITFIKRNVYQKELLNHGDFYFAIIRNSKLKDSKNNIATNTWLQQKLVMSVGRRGQLGMLITGSWRIHIINVHSYIYSCSYTTSTSEFFVPTALFLVLLVLIALTDDGPKNHWFWRPQLR